MRAHAFVHRDALARDAALRRAHASMADEEQPRLPDYFPLAPKGCAKQANAFFECFAAAGAPVVLAPDAEARLRRALSVQPLTWNCRGRIVGTSLAYLAPA